MNEKKHESPHSILTKKLKDFCKNEKASITDEKSHASELKNTWLISSIDCFLLVTGTTFAILYGISPAISAILTGKIVTYLVVVNQTLPEYDGIIFYQNYLLLLGFWMSIFAFFQSLCFNIAATRIIEQFKKINLHHNIQIADSKIKILQANISENVGILIRNVVQLISGLLVAFYYNWQLAATCTILVPTLIFFTMIISRQLTTAENKEKVKTTEASELAQEVITGKTTQMLNSENYALSLYENKLKQASRWANKKNLYCGISSGFLQFTVFTYMGLGALYGTWLYQNGIIIEIGYVYTVISSIASGAFPLVTIQTQLKTLKNGLLTYKVNEIKTISSKIESTKNLTITIQAKGNKNEKSNSNRNDYFTSNQESKKLLRPNSISLLYWKLYFIVAICIVLHSLGPPIYAFLNGAYFAIFEVNKDDYMTEMKSLFKFYIIMAVLTGVALSIYTKLLGKIGEKMSLILRANLYSSFLHQKAKFFDNHLNSNENLLSLLNNEAIDTRAAYDLRLGQFANAILCVVLSYGFAYQKNTYMGILGSVCFFIQSLIQFSIGLICIKSSKNQQFYKALKFASANGLQQLTQAICYIIGYWLTKQGCIEEALVIHKIIQTLLQSSMMIPNAPSFVQEVKKSKTAYKKICPYLVAETEDKPKGEEKSHEAK